MDKLYNLKESMIDELEKYADKPVSGSSVAMIDTLAHATKNLCKIIEDGEMMDGSFAGGSYRGGSYRGGSYEGGRGGQGLSTCLRMSSIVKPSRPRLQRKGLLLIISTMASFVNG